MKEKAKILKLDYYFVGIYLFFLISKFLLALRINSIEKNVKPSCMWGVAGKSCSYYTQEHSFIKVISDGIIPLCIVVFSIWYIINVIKNKSVLLNCKIIKIIMIIVLSLIIIFLGGMVK